jgi:hypothetical protein
LDRKYESKGILSVFCELLAVSGQTFNFEGVLLIISQLADFFLVDCTVENQSVKIMFVPYLVCMSLSVYLSIVS